MAANVRREWTDQMMLEALDLVERVGLTRSEAAQRLGVPANAVIGLVFRCNRDCDAVLDLATRVGRRDGDLPARWWAAAPGAKRRTSGSGGVAA